jgi:hypothetical protein
LTLETFCCKPCQQIIIITPLPSKVALFFSEKEETKNKKKNLLGTTREEHDESE